MRQCQHSHCCQHGDHVQHLNPLFRPPEEQSPPPGDKREKKQQQDEEDERMIDPLNPPDPHAPLLPLKTSSYLLHWNSARVDLAVKLIVKFLLLFILTTFHLHRNKTDKRDLLLRGNNLQFQQQCRAVPA